MCIGVKLNCILLFIWCLTINLLKIKQLPSESNTPVTSRQILRHQLYKLLLKSTFVTHRWTGMRGRVHLWSRFMSRLGKLFDWKE